MEVNDTGLLIKYKGAGLDDVAIGKRLGITAKQVAERWERLVEEQKTKLTTGYQDLADQYHIMAHQYQLLGESLKLIAMGLVNVPTPEEIKACITSDPDATYCKLLATFIFLRPYVKRDPSAALEEFLKAQQKAN